MYVVWINIKQSNKIFHSMIYNSWVRLPFRYKHYFVTSYWPLFVTTRSSPAFDKWWYSKKINAYFIFILVQKMRFNKDCTVLINLACSNTRRGGGGSLFISLFSIHKKWGRGCSADATCLHINKPLYIYGKEKLAQG